MRRLNVFLLFVCMVFISACKEENSGDIDSDTPFYQRYMVKFSDQETMAYANFTKNKDALFKEIKLEGEQSIRVNGKEMNFNELEELDITYAYSRNLGKATDVSYVFVRTKNKVYKNSVQKTDILPIAIPSEIATVANNVAFAWQGEPSSAGGEVSATLTRSTDDGAVLYSGQVTEGKTEIIFTDVPAGNYLLTVERYKKIETKENNLPAKGEINVYYTAAKNVIVR